MDDNPQLRNILKVFAHYGFKKASMDDLARAAEVSRQTLYSRHKTKEGVLDWAVAGFFSDVQRDAITALQNPRASVERSLLDAFDRWSGDHVSLLQEAPHGSEVLDMGTESLARTGVDYQEGFDEALVAFLRDRDLCRTQKQAADKAYLLMMASKGLLIKSADGEAFRIGMKRVIRAAL